MDSQINIMKAVHEGMFDRIKGKSIKLSKRQGALLNTKSRVYLTHRTSQKVT